MNESLLNSQPKSYWEKMTGPGGKFHAETEEEAKEKIGKAKEDSDNYIKILESKMDEIREYNKQLREDNMAKASLEDLIDQQQRTRQLASSEQPLAKEVREPTVDHQKLESLVESLFERRTVQSKEQDNFKFAENKLKEHYGDAYSQVLKQHSDELGLTAEDIDSMARKNPKLLFRTLGLDQKQEDSFSPPPRSNQSSTFKPTTEKRTWSYYQKLKKDNPNLYHDKKINAQMIEDYTKYGKDFEDGDFHTRTFNSAYT